jgi:hypothetical protein
MEPFEVLPHPTMNIFRGKNRDNEVVRQRAEHFAPIPHLSENMYMDK